MDGSSEGKTGVFFISLNRNLKIWMNVQVDVGSLRNYRSFAFVHCCFSELGSRSLSKSHPPLCQGAWLSYWGLKWSFTLQRCMLEITISDHRIRCKYQPNHTWSILLTGSPDTVFWTTYMNQIHQVLVDRDSPNSSKKSSTPDSKTTWLLKINQHSLSTHFN